ncbi:anti-repressor protein [Clostridium cavendishii DSM 21758]|uniref:Anti-repressor protein n=1 Tax=Clostridium cavendishii DSM 21758 TaxID=1121302 RepID=A0A1M6K4K0_9CLOT|nr:antA/AntB antirepressor family protein [Clostridium cavendishii]SHJ53790.1 anti-repressor protein [Clostridium cavendishii DSM 21758]
MDKKIQMKQEVRDLIKIMDEHGKQLVDARELHEFLESKQDFSTWIKNRIEKYEFVENVDFSTFHKFVEREGTNLGSKRTEYVLTIEMAKELSMVENNDKGKEARKYFIECEKAYLNSNSQVKKLTTEEMLELQFNFTKEVKAEVKEVKDKVTVIQEFVDATELSTADSKRLTSLANKIVVTLLGGKKSKAYETLSKKAFSDLYKQLHREFGVSSIAEIKKKDVELAKEVIQNYKAPIVLQEEIAKANNQINFKGVI